MKPIRLYWWQGEGEHDPCRQNFGDYLSPRIVEMVSGRRVVFSPVNKADMLGIGTILSKERKAKRFFVPHRLHIWGSGAGHCDERFSPRHHYCAVRGEKTLACLPEEKRQTIALGDPGLLVKHYWENRPRPCKKYALGIIPHFVDHDSPAIRQLLEMRGAKFINVLAPIDEILSDILSCAYIVSSCLHGLIVSDAFDIPNRRIIVSRNIRSQMKFADYYSAFGLAEPAPINASASLPKSNEDPEVLIGAYDKKNVDHICDKLIAAFPAL